MDEMKQTPQLRLVGANGEDISSAPAPQAPSGAGEPTPEQQTAIRQAIQYLRSDPNADACVRCSAYIATASRIMFDTVGSLIARYLKANKQEQHFDAVMSGLAGLIMHNTDRLKDDELPDNIRWAADQFEAMINDRKQKLAELAAQERARGFATPFKLSLEQAKFHLATGKAVIIRGEDTLAAAMALDKMMMMCIENKVAVTHFTVGADSDVPGVTSMPKKWWEGCCNDFNRFKEVSASIDGDLLIVDNVLALQEGKWSERRRMIRRLAEKRPVFGVTVSKDAKMDENNGSDVLVLHAIMREAEGKNMLCVGSDILDCGEKKQG